MLSGNTVDRGFETPARPSGVAMPEPVSGPAPSLGRFDRVPDRVPATPRVRSVLLIGAYPPPLGGNSVHLQRLFESLRASGCDAAVLDYLGGGLHARASTLPPAPDGVWRLGSTWIQRLTGLWRASRRTAPETIVHIHVSALGRFKWFGPVLLWLFRRQRKVITVHSGSFVEQARRIPAAYLRWLMRSFQSVIVVNGPQYEFLRETGIPEDRLSCIPAYLPAIARPALLPESVAKRTAGRIVIVTSGDLTATYQYAPLIDCLEQLDPDRYLMVFALYGRSDPAYAEPILARLARHSNAVVLRDQPADAFVSVLAASDAYVRLTTTDGDSVAIREAMALGKPVLASDVVPRPTGCSTVALDRPVAVLDWVRGIRKDEPARAGTAGPDDANFGRILRTYIA